MPDQEGQVERLIVGARVSTDEQKKRGISIPHQTEAARKKVVELGAVVVAYCIEPGVSGADYESRAELQKALTMIEAGQADGMVWYDLSRLTRDIEYLQTIRRRVKRAGGRLYFCRSDYQDNAVGFLQEGVEAVVNQYNRINTAEVSIANRRNVARKGRQPARSRSPYGYHVVTRHDVIKGTHTDADLGRYEVVEDEATIVREIFSRYAAGDSIRTIARDLTARQVKPPKEARGGGVTPEGQKTVGYAAPVWRPGTIRIILNNPAYKGQAAFGRMRRVVDEARLAQGFRCKVSYQAVDPSQWIFIECPALVDPDTWEAANARLGEAKHLHAGRPDRKYMLTGLLRCPGCHQTMGVYHEKQGKKRQLIYRCRRGAPSHSVDRSVCTRKPYNANRIEAQVIAAIEDVVGRPDNLEAAFNFYQQRQLARYSDEELAALRRDQTDVERQLKLAIAAQIAADDKGIDPTVYEDTLRELSVRRRDLSERLRTFEEARQRAAAGPPPQSKTQLLAQIGADVREALRSEVIPGAAKQKMLARIVDTIYPTPSGGLRVSFRVGTFAPRQRWVWNAGEWEIIDQA